MNKEDICFVAARLNKKDYTFNAIEKCGFKIVTPYKDYNLLFRLVREVWFRLKLPLRKIFYNKKAIDSSKKKFIVFDPLITPTYLVWLKDKNPNAKILIDYVNRADTTINPNDLPDFVERWSYDRLDCEKYHMSFIPPSYFGTYVFDFRDYAKKYDVLFVGRDKGRLQYILGIEESLRKQGVSTYFHICANRRFMRFNNPHYKKVLDYDEYLELLKISKASLNVSRKDQDAITLRELECIFDGVKCITTNKNITKFGLYDKTRFFVLDNNYEEINAFLKTPFKPISPEELSVYDFENVVNRIFLEN